jgi:hypothetical protein
MTKKDDRKSVRRKGGEGLIYVVPVGSCFK